MRELVCMSSHYPAFDHLQYGPFHFSMNSGKEGGSLFTLHSESWCFGSAERTVSCPAGYNLWKIRLVTLRTFLGLLHTSAGLERGWRWPYVDVSTSTWLQLSPISIRTSASAPVGRPSDWTCYNLIGTFK